MSARFPTEAAVFTRTAAIHRAASTVVAEKDFTVMDSAAQVRRSTIIGPRWIWVQLAGPEPTQPTFLITQPNAIFPNEQDPTQPNTCK